MTAITLIGIGMIVVLLVQSMVMLRKRARRIEPDSGTPITETIECLRCGTVRVTTGTIKGLTHHIEKRTYKFPADRDEQSGEWLTCRTIGHKWPIIPELSVFGDERRRQS